MSSEIEVSPQLRTLEKKIIFSSSSNLKFLNENPEFYLKYFAFEAFYVVKIKTSNGEKKFVDSIASFFLN